MASEPSSTGSSDCLSSEWYEYLCMSPANPTLFTPEETFFAQCTPESLFLSAPSDLEYLYERFLETLSDPSAHEIAANSSTSLYHVPEPSSVQPQIAAPVEDVAKFCAVCSTSTFLPPPLSTFPPPNWRKIPQKVYDYGRKQLDFTLLPPISFSVNGFPGVNMGDAFHNRFTGLDGRDDLVLQGASSAISCRLSFPGYPRNRSPQISTLYWNKPKRDPIKRSKLAHHVARKVKQYLDSMTSSQPMDGSTHKRWEIGKGFMRLEDMFLVQLESVSKGSFQPEIWVVDPTM